MPIYTILRKLAKQDYYQTLFILSKEMNNIRIFNNDCDFTYLQIDFLKYLGFYYSLYSDINYGEVSDIVLKDSIYEDSYIYYKNKVEKKQLAKNQTTDVRDIIPGLGTKEHPGKPATRWLFKNNKEGTS